MSDFLPKYLRFNTHLIVLGIIICIASISLAYVMLAIVKKQNMLVVIATYGDSLLLTEFKESLNTTLTQQPLKNRQTVKTYFTNAHYQHNEIEPMIKDIVTKGATLVITGTTPVSQVAKEHIHNIPIVYSLSTDPVRAGLIPSSTTNNPNSNMVGVSDRPNFALLLKLAHQLLPQMKTIGLLFTTTEINDLATLDMLREAAKAYDIKIVSIPIDNVQNIETIVHDLNKWADCLYINDSGKMIALTPVIMAAAKELKIPIFHFNSQSVIAHESLASYVISYHRLGEITAQLALRILNGENPGDLTPIYPQDTDYIPMVSLVNANKLGIDAQTLLADQPHIQFIS